MVIAGRRRTPRSHASVGHAHLPAETVSTALTCDVTCETRVRSDAREGQLARSARNLRPLLNRSAPPSDGYLQRNEVDTAPSGQVEPGACKFDELLDVPVDLSPSNVEAGRIVDVLQVFDSPHQLIGGVSQGAVVDEQFESIQR